MDKQVKQKWLAALRSGEYKQGKYRLRETDVLWDATGVLCDLAERQGVIGPPQYLDDAQGVFTGYRYGDKQSGWHATGLPEAVIKWSGVSYSRGYKVAMMGDYGKNFNQLADWIEENL